MTEGNSSDLRDETIFDSLPLCRVRRICELEPALDEGVRHEQPLTFCCCLARVGEIIIPKLLRKTLSLIHFRNNVLRYRCFDICFDVERTFHRERPLASTLPVR